ncbi:MAG: hypothetical protein JNG88_02840 [Phycisphaerales bacterium]|nr:hypothetical protein [Phycisphaerales bacterium]
MLPRKLVARITPDEAPAQIDARDDEAALDCPACGYDLRGFANARCPECGSAFDINQLRAGAARVNEPTWLDAADVWQPHQLLIRSLFELIVGAARPSARLTRTSVTAPISAALVMFVLGELWITLICAALLALGIALHCDASPAACARTALVVWAPALLVVRAALYAGLVWPATDARLLRVAGVTWKGRARVAAYWLPALGVWCSLAVALGAAAAPDFALPLAWMAPTLTSAAAMLGIARAAGRRFRQIGPFAVACCVIAICAAVLAANLVLPDRFEPPIWVYVP